jgi:hypothetical protein
MSGGCGCSVRADPSSPRAGGWATVRVGSASWPLVGPELGRTQDGREFYRGRIDDLDQNALFRLAKVQSRAGVDGQAIVVRQLLAAGWYRILTGPDVTLARCSAHGGRA